MYTECTGKSLLTIILLEMQLSFLSFSTFVIEAINNNSHNKSIFIFTFINRHDVVQFRFDIIGLSVTYSRHRTIKCPAQNPIYCGNSPHIIDELTFSDYNSTIQFYFSPVKAFPTVICHILHQYDVHLYGRKVRQDFDKTVSENCSRVTAYHGELYCE